MATARRSRVPAVLSCGSARTRSASELPWHLCRTSTARRSGASCRTPSLPSATRGRPRSWRSAIASSPPAATCRRPSRSGHTRGSKTSFSGLTGELGRTNVWRRSLQPTDRETHMSLEAEIKNLRTSIDKLVEVLSSLPAQPAPAVPSSPQVAAAASSPPSPQAAPAAATPAAPAPSTQQAAEPANAQPDYQKDIKPRVLKLGEQNMDALLELFKEFGVSKAPELKPEQYAAFVEKIDVILAGKATAQQTESLV